MADNAADIGNSLEIGISDFHILDNRAVVIQRVDGAEQSDIVLCRIVEVQARNKMILSVKSPDKFHNGIPHLEGTAVTVQRAVFLDDVPVHDDVGDEFSASRLVDAKEIVCRQVAETVKFFDGRNFIAVVDQLGIFAPLGIEGEFPRRFA